MRYVMLMSTIPARDSNELVSLLREYDKRKLIFEDEGIEVKFLGFNDVPSPAYWFKRECDESVFFLDEKKTETKRDYINGVSWARDLFQIVEGTALIPRHYNLAVPPLLDWLGFNGAKIMNDFGEGGIFVRAGNAVFYSGLEMLEKDEKFLMSKGLRTLPMSLTKNSKATCPYERTLAQRINECVHIDTEFNVMKTNQGKYLLLVTPEYYVTYGKFIDRVAEWMSTQPYVTTDDHLTQPVNFTVLPDSTVVINKQCSNTIAYLKKNGVKVISLTPLPTEVNQCGGIRCRTNIMEI